MNLLPVLAGSSIPARNALDSRWFCGIDLGTTNSLVAVVDSHALRSRDYCSAIRVLPVKQPTRNGVTESVLFSSVIAEVFPGEWTAGQGAKEARWQGLRKDRQIFYSTKSEMGIGRDPYYPFAASSKFDCPYKIAGEILKNLATAVRQELGLEALENLVVTVPASFQTSARKDTLRAADLAGIQLGAQSLLDEPNAAFLDYILTAASQEALPLDLTTPTIILTVDFGGGTCDVSVLRVQFESKTGRLTVANLAISRYERLGGDNIDLAIAEHILLPELLRQNGVQALDLSWAEKKNYVLPQLLPVAEALKLGICSEYATQLGLRCKEKITRDSIRATQLSTSITVPAKDRLRTFSLRDPRLTIEQFEEVMTSFLDRDLLYAHGTEFNSVTSIFAPVQDALNRAGVGPAEIDGILLVGGSSFIPQVQQALQSHFPEARLLRFPSAERALSAVARGAALHSFFLHGIGLPLVKPIAQETIGLLAQDDVFRPLICAGTELPFPSNSKFETYRGLSVPRDLMPELDIVIAAETPTQENKVLAVAHLRPDELPRAGDEIEVRFRLDANKVLEVEATLLSNSQTRCEVSLENPLSSTGHETEHQREILRLEQELADANTRHEPLSEKLTQIERLYELFFDERKYERAIDWAKKALQLRAGPDFYALNLIGNAYRELAAYDRAEKFYRELATLDAGWGGGHFNLALALESQGRISDALEAAAEAIRLDVHEGAYLALRARLLKKLARAIEANAAFHEAARLLDLSCPLTEFQLSWRIMVAHSLNDVKTVSELEAVRKRQGDVPLPYDPGALPKTAAAIVVRRAG
jgi:molecular chaperone DnaK